MRLVRTALVGACVACSSPLDAREQTVASVMRIPNATGAFTANLPTPGAVNQAAP